MKILKSLCVFSVVSVTACSTPYQDTGFSGGVSASMIDASTAQISAAVNAYTSQSTAYQYAMLKSAEFTLQQGFGHFQIVSEEVYAKTGSVTNYNSTYSSDVSGYSTYGGYQGYGSGSGYGAATTTNYRKPHVDFLIVMYPGPKPANAPAGVYDARQVVSVLGAEIRKE